VGLSVADRYSARDGRPLKLWDVATGRAKGPGLEGKHSVDGLIAFSSNGRWLASVTGTTIVLWDAESGRVVDTVERDGTIVALSFLSDSNILMSVNESRVDRENASLNLWDAEPVRESVALQGHSASISGLEFSADGKTMVSASRDRAVKTWDAVSGRERNSTTLPGGSYPVNAMAYSRDGTTLSLGGGSPYKNPGELSVWRFEQAVQPEILEGHTEPVFAVAFSPDGQMLASGGGIQANEVVNAKSELKLWEARTGTLLRSLEGHFAYVYSVAFRPDGKTLASSGYDGTIRLWETATGRLERTLKEHEESVGSVAFSPDGTLLASASDDRTVKLWDPQAESSRMTLSGHGRGVCCVAFSPDGETLASSDGSEIRLWDPRTGQERSTLGGIVSPVRLITFSPDGRTLASGHADGTIRLWQAR
jgi:WD40 repeat protein